MGVLPDDPNAAPPELRQDSKPPWLALGVAFWDKLKAQKPKRPGRRRMTVPMIAKAALAWVKMPNRVLHRSREIVFLYQKLQWGIYHIPLPLTRKPHRIASNWLPAAF